NVRPQVITLKTIKNLDSMTLKELVGILKVHEQDLAQDEGTKKGKLLSLADQRPKRNFVSKETSSKAFVVKYASEKESNDDDSNKEDNELSLITRKIKKIGKIRTPLGSIDHPKDPCTRKRKVQSSAISARNEGTSSQNDSEEEANLCLMADASTSKAELALDVSSDDENS
ncbi:hypothetical protein D0Y65_038860, partial [Glycine soja]